MTPRRLSEVRCPSCARPHWIIDSDFHASWLAAGIDRPYSEREYSCKHCSFRGSGFEVVQQSPPSFFLQPDELDPMTARDFELWVGILRRNYPRHPALWHLGTQWYPAGSALARLRSFLLLARHLVLLRWAFAA
jgi:hypothetical protein